MYKGITFGSRSGNESNTYVIQIGKYIGKRGAYRKM